MDWDRVMQNAARGTDFRGRSAADEQAYFESFAEMGRSAVFSTPFHAVAFGCAAVVGFVQATFMLK